MSKLDELKNKKRTLGETPEVKITTKEDIVQTKKPAKPTKLSPASQQEEVKAELKKALQEQSQKSNSSSKTMYIAIAAVAVLTAGYFTMEYFKKPEPVVNQEILETTSVEETAPPPISEEELAREELRKQGIGIKDLDQSTNMLNDTLVEQDTFVKDLLGADVKELYEVERIDLVIDFVNYVKHRSITGEGVELYWLSGDYLGRPCRITVPFRIFKELPQRGSVTCDVEIVTTVNGEKFATHFEVRNDFNNLNALPKE